MELDISGEQKIKVTRNVLCQVPGSRLEKMFSGRQRLKTGKNIFINRDVDAFLSMISYLRNDQRIGKFNTEKEEDRFKLELDYWGIKNHVEESKRLIEELLNANQQLKQSLDEEIRTGRLHKEK